MEVRTEVFIQAINQFINDMFAKTELNLKNATNAIAVKMYVHNKLGNQLSILADEKGMIDVDFLEDITKEEMKKLGSIIIPAIGTSYKLNEVDVHNLFAKIREMGDKE